MLSKNVKMTEGPIFWPMVVYTIPLMLSGMLQQFYNSADLMVVGSYAENGTEALAAIGTTGSLTNLIIGLFLGLSVGSCAVLSQYLGAKEDRNASEVVHTSITTAIILGVVLAVFGSLVARPILIWMNVEEGPILDMATLYMRIYFAGLPASMLYNFGSSILRAKGDTKYPLIVLFISGFVNVMLNLLTVIVFKWSVAGVALATVVSQVLSATLVIIYVCRMKDCCKLELRKLRIYKDKLLRMIRVGIPAGIQSLFFSISNVMLQSSVNELGKIAMAGNTAASSIDAFIYIAQNAVYHAALAFTGQNFGVRDMKRIKRVGISASAIVTIIGLVLGGIVLIFAHPLLVLFTIREDPAIAEEVRNEGFRRLQVTAMLYFMCGLMEVYTGMLRGMGSSTTPMIISLIGACGFRLFWIFVVFPMEPFHNMKWLYWSYPISWLLTASAQFTAFMITRHRIESKLKNGDDKLTI